MLLECLCSGLGQVDQASFVKLGADLERVIDGQSERVGHVFRRSCDAVHEESEHNGLDV